MTTHSTILPGPLSNLVRQFNKRVYNPAMRVFAGRFVYAVVQHMGRKSGKLYSTPVVAHHIEDGFIIPLPYSDLTDWCQNVLTAGRATLRWHNDVFEVTAPEIVDASVALPQFPLPLRLTFKTLRIRQFLRLKIV